MPRNLLSAPALQKQKRAVTKTVCYRLFMLLITVTVALVVVGDIGDALNIGLATNLLKTGTYYAYERLWDRVRWGVSN
jgi:uncharacterized membrane protein